MTVEDIDGGGSLRAVAVFTGMACMAKTLAFWRALLIVKLTMEGSQAETARGMREVTDQAAADGHTLDQLVDGLTHSERERVSNALAGRVGTHH